MVLQEVKEILEIIEEDRRNCWPRKPNYSVIRDKLLALSCLSINATDQSYLFWNFSFVRLKSFKPLKSFVPLLIWKVSDNLI